MSSKKRAKKRKHIDIVFEKPTLSKEQRLELFTKQFPLLKEHRKNRDAPVDSMGCESLGDRDGDPKVFRYQTLISLMLSSQTKDQITAAAMSKLKANGGCTVDSILKMSEKELAELIYPVGFYSRKAKYIKQATQMIKDEFNGDIPDTIEKLKKLPGVGVKMATLAMNCAWKKCIGIGVDVHVHRISNRLGWVNTKTPEATQKELEDLIPKDKWEEVNVLLVGFGQQRCKGHRPKCSDCLLNSDCFYYKSQKIDEKKKKKKQE